MTDYKVREILELTYKDYYNKGYFQSNTQAKAANAILQCDSGKLVSTLARALTADTQRFIIIPAITVTFLTAKPF